MKTAYPTIKQSINDVGLLIGCMVLACPLLFAEDLIGKEASFFLYYLVSMGAGLFALLFRRKKQTAERAFHFEIGDTSLLPFIIVATLALSFGVTAPLISLIPVPEFVEKMFLEFAGKTGFFSFLAIVVAAPVLEELIFRGIILDGFLKRYSPVKAILFSSFLFGFIHLNPWQFVGAGMLGIFMGWVYYRTRSVSLTIIIHLANNLTAFLMNSMSEVTIENIDETIVDFYGGSVPFISITSFAILILAACLYFLNGKMESHPHDLFTDLAEVDPELNSLKDSPGAVHMGTTGGEMR